ncbi:MAG: T9SS type A sorting domain-containing protein, partial [Flavobacteriales bacterium]
PCNYPVNFAMALFGMPTAHRYYQVSEGQFIQYPNGTIHVIATLHNAYNPGNGFNVDVEFINGMDWADWSTQGFLTSFKADCGGIAANHQDWMYFLLNNNNATITGFGGYAGSVLNLAHAPSNNYFGFQFGNGANNYNGADNGFGGWFTYSGTFLVNGQQIMSGNAAGAGDFAFELDCCPDYTITRCWTAMDCSGNITQHCQTISNDKADTNTPVLPGKPSLTPELDILVKVSPNPAIEIANFSVRAAKNGQATLEVFDVTGAKVALLLSTLLEAGQETRVSMDVSNLAAGVYMYRFTNGGETEAGRIVVGK